MSVYSLRLLPDLRPRLVDPLWFDVDRPVDLNAELKELEKADRDAQLAVQQRGKDILPIGKTSQDNSDDDDDNNDDEYDDDDNDDDEEEDDDSEMNDDYSEPIE